MEFHLASGELKVKLGKRLKNSNCDSDSDSSDSSSSDISNMDIFS